MPARAASGGVAALAVLVQAGGLELLHRVKSGVHLGSVDFFEKALRFLAGAKE